MTGTRTATFAALCSLAALLAGSAQAAPTAAKQPAGATAAINAVKNYKPQGGSMNLGAVVAMENKTQGALHNKFRDLGWSATPQGGTWTVTWSYLSSMGRKRQATWKVQMPKGAVTAVDGGAHEQEAAAAGAPKITR